MPNLVSIINKKIYIIFLIFLLLLNIVNIPNSIAEDDPPNLIIDKNNSFIPQNITEGETSEFVVRIKNQGVTNAVDDIIVKLRIDDSIVAINTSSDDLSPGSSISINIGWMPTFDDIGIHLLSIEIYYSISPIPLDFLDKPDFEVLERPTDLEITKVDFPDSFIVNNTARIYASVQNNGKNSTNKIHATLKSSADGEIETVVKKDSLIRDETYDFSFNWTPSNFGSQKISIEVIYNNYTHDFKEISIVVGVYLLQWWNENWHYRQFLTVTGSGNVSESFNFTEFLNSLGIFSQRFENNTIRIIEYNRYGDIIGEISVYKFDEDINFDTVKNSKGTIIWNVAGSSEEKYYCIYFDVEINKGERTELDETEYISESGDAIINYYGSVEGWWMDILEPVNGSYSLVDEPINITVSTKAKAENVSAFIFMNEHESNNYTLYLEDINDKTLWGYENFYFNEEGIWTIRIISRDWASYKPVAVEHVFYVGKPDVEIINITFSTNRPFTSPEIYKNDLVNITAHVIAHNATVENVDISITLFDIKNAQVIHTNKTEKTLLKDEHISILFSWNANVSGNINITIILDPDNIIDEKNESNNEVTVLISVIDWPDLEFEKIILPSLTVKEFDRVKINVNIVNKGEGNAIDYKIGLYIEPVSQGYMSYTTLVDSILVSVTKGNSKQISMYWDSAKIGEWYVGVMVIVNDTKMDPFGKNRLLSDKNLKVNPIERNPPMIWDVIVEPDYQEQGSSITISAKIRDDTRLDSVTVIITNPLGLSNNYSMGRTIGDEFQYIYVNTDEVGIYSFRIDAVDITYYKNKATKHGNFSISKDTSFPIIVFFEAQPRVQLKGQSVSITCIATDNNEIKSVTVSITDPSNDLYKRNMQHTTQDKYEYSDTFDIIGIYIFQIEVKDIANNAIDTIDKSFWITSDLEDKDNDGMSDIWEEKQGFDSEDPNDANQDPDGDGYSNLEEFKMGTNPKKDIFSENAGYRIKENSFYLAGSIVLFLIIILISIFGKWRKLI